MVSAHVRRHQVAFAKERGLSVRWACALLSVARSALRYQSRLTARDEPVLVAMRELVSTVMIEEFQRGYNEVRPRSSLGQLIPLEFKRKLSKSRPESEPELLPALAGRETALR